MSGRVGSLLLLRSYLQGGRTSLRSVKRRWHDKIGMAGLPFTALQSDGGEERVLVPILQCGQLVSYAIPSFPVVTVNLRRIKYQGYLADGRL